MISAVASFYRARFPEGSFARKVMVMFTGTALGQVGAILMAPLLTRIYSPEMFGVLGLFTASLSILSVLAALRYEMAFPLMKSSEDKANLLAVCIVSLIFTGLVGFGLVSLMDYTCSTSKWMGALTPYGWMLPVGIFCVGSYQVIMNYATRQGEFGAISRTKIYQGIMGPLVQISLGIGGAKAWGLVIGFIAGQSTGISLLFKRMVLEERALRHVSLRGMKAVALRYYRFPLISSWSGLLEAAGGSYLLLVAMPLLYSNTVAGFIFLADRIIGRPLLLVSTSILQVYIGDMSRLIDDYAAMRRRFLQLAFNQFLIVAAWLLLINLTAPYFFPVIFGPQWVPAVPYLQILSICYLPQMVVHALIHTLQVLERQGMSAAWEGTRFVAVLGVFAISFSCGASPLHALLSYSIVQAVAQVILFMLMYHSIQSLQKGHSHA